MAKAFFFFFNNCSIVNTRWGGGPRTDLQLFLRKIIQNLLNNNIYHSCTPPWPRSVLLVLAGSRTPLVWTILIGPSMPLPLPLLPTVGSLVTLLQHHLTFRQLVCFSPGWLEQTISSAKSCPMGSWRCHWCGDCT